MSDWTPERKAELRRRWALGESAGEIAQVMPGGFSRNAVIGKIKRMGLPARTTRTWIKPGVQSGTGGKGKFVDWAERRRVILDVQANKGTIGDAAMRLGIAYDTARKDAIRLGIPFYDRPQRPRSEHRPISLPRMPCQPKAAMRTSVSCAEALADVPWVAVDILLTKDASAFSKGRCKWPVNDSKTADGHLFCGHATVMGTVYCTEHQRVAYASVPGRQKIYASRR